jgi:uncharacterized protein (DUF2237 family)
MLRDDREDNGHREPPARNVLGEPLDLCSITPRTGFYRDGCYNTGREDIGSHTVCAVMTRAFLDFPNREPGDRWCLCAPRWQEALEASRAPRVVLRATRDRKIITKSSDADRRLARHRLTIEITHTETAEMMSSAYGMAGRAAQLNSLMRHS